jgi:MurNAc alpha-1-phosphate uridylyltransferase
VTEQIRQAMILAAGLGTRMLHLTEDKPKAMVEVDGKPLIDHALDRLIGIGIERVVVNLHYKADVLEDYLTNRSDIEIIISDERDQILDTGGGIVRALPHFGDQPFITHNCDTIWIEKKVSNLERLVQAWQPNSMDALMLLAPSEGSLGYDGKGDFFMGPDGELIRRGTEDKAPYVWAGVQIIKPEFFESAPRGAFSTNVVWDKILDRLGLRGIELDGTWMHVGTPDGVEDAEALIRSAL